jgi:hypothetical protein
LRLCDPVGGTSLGQCASNGFDWGACLNGGGGRNIDNEGLSVPLGDFQMWIRFNERSFVHIYLPGVLLYMMDHCSTNRRISFTASLLRLLGPRTLTLCECRPDLRRGLRANAADPLELLLGRGSEGRHGAKLSQHIPPLGRADAWDFVQLRCE